MVSVVAKNTVEKNFEIFQVFENFIFSPRKSEVLMVMFLLVH